MWMLDTNICIAIIKQRPREVLEHLRALDPAQVALSAITVAELEFGVAKSSRPDQNREALALFLTPLEVLAFDDRAAAAYGEVRAGLERQGTPIGSLDLLICAHALSCGRILVTNNEREFTRIVGLRVENWVRTSP